MPGDRRHLSASIRRAALPWGYTVVTWTSGGVVIHRHGPPSLGAAYLFLLGAALGLGAVALAAGPEAQESDVPPWSAVAASALAAAVALGAAGGLAQAIHTGVAYFAVGLATTLVYFLTRALVAAIV